MERFRSRGNRHVLQLFGTYRSHGGNDVALLGRTIAGNDYLFQYLLVFLKHYVNHIACDLHLFGLLANIGEHKHFSIVRYINRVLTIKVRHRTDSRSLDNNRCLDNGLTRLIFHNTRNDTCLQPHTDQQETKHRHHTNCTDIQFHKR